MSGTEIVQAIGTLGFPIVCCGALFWYVVKLSDQHKQESTAMTAAINGLTSSIDLLIEKLGGG